MLEFLPYEPQPEYQTSSVLILDNQLPEIEQDLEIPELIEIPEIEPLATEVNVLSCEELTQRLESLENPYPNYQAGEDIAQYRLVYLGEDNKIYKCSPINSTTALPIGFVLGNVSNGQFVAVQNDGELTNDSWSLNKNQSIFVGIDGQVAQEIGENDVVFVQVGTIVNSTKILIHFEEPIWLTSS